MSEKTATAQTSYNTNEEVCFKKWKQGKYRDFLLTLNCEINNDIDLSKTELFNKYYLIKKYLTSLKYNYFISSLEINKHDFYHIHIFIQFNTPHKLSIKKLEGSHVNIINKTINKVIEYVKKDGVILDELGIPKYISGNPTIKDISLSRFSDINENGNAQFFRIYKEIKKDNQGLYNTSKKLYIKSKLPTENFNDFNFLKLKDHKIKLWPIKMIINENILTENLLDLILNNYNEPIQYKYFPADIEEILFIIPNDIETKYRNLIQFIKKYTHKIHDEKGIHHILDNDYDKGIIDSSETLEEYI